MVGRGGISGFFLSGIVVLLTQLREEKNNTVQRPTNTNLVRSNLAVSKAILKVSVSAGDNFLTSFFFVLSHASSSCCVPIAPNRAAI